MTVLLGLAPGLLVAPAMAGAASPADRGGDRLVVAFAPSADAGDRHAARAAVGATLVDRVLPRVQVLAVAEGRGRDAAAALNADREVAWVEEDVRQRAQAAPNDPSFPRQWALANTGQYAGVPGADIDALAAWDVSRGAGVLVGVVDSGVSATHADSGLLYTNPGETPGNGLDDDRNGLADDVAGWDFAGDDADPADDNGHGTSVGSIVNAATDNGRGMAGVAPAARVIHAKALGADGSGWSSNVAAAMDYVARQGARIVNLSLGGPTRSRAQASVIAAHPTTLFVVAAGNANTDIDGTARSYPCVEPAANVLCVGASTSADLRASFSNYGRTSVDAMAPGQTIHGASWSTGGISLWDGTSFASPVTAGIAALGKAYRPAATAVELKAAILRSVDPVGAFSAITVSGGRVNAAATLQALGAAVGSGPAAPQTADPATSEPLPPAGAAPEPLAQPEQQPEPEPEPEPAAAAPVDPVPVAVPRLPPPTDEQTDDGRSVAPPRPLARVAPWLRLAGRRHALVRVTFGARHGGRRATVRVLVGRRVLGTASVRPRGRRAQTIRLALTRRGRMVLRHRAPTRAIVEVRSGTDVVRTPLLVRSALRRR